MATSVFHITPVNAAPCLRQAGSLKSAIKRAAREFPAGVVAVRPMKMDELVQLAADGVALPVFVREHVRTILAAQRAAQRRREEPQARPSWRPDGRPTTRDQPP